MLLLGGVFRTVTLIPALFVRQIPSPLMVKCSVNVRLLHIQLICSCSVMAKYTCTLLIHDASLCIYLCAHTYLNIDTNTM